MRGVSNLLECGNRGRSGPRPRAVGCHALLRVALAVEVAQHRCVVAGEALGPEIAQRLSAVALASVPASDDPVGPGVHGAAPGVAAAFALRERLALEVAVGGRAPDAEVAGDPLPRLALAVEVPHLPVRRHALLPAGGGHGQRPLGRWRRVGPNRAALGHCVLAAGLLGVPQLPSTTGERQLQRLGQVLQQVEAVSDLHRVRHPVAASRGIGAGRGHGR